MKIYFENGELSPEIEFDFHVDYYCDATYGYSQNVFDLNMYLNASKNAVVYTNSLAALSMKYAWNEEIQDFDIFMREHKGRPFKRISELYGGKIRISQNVRAMWMSGCFGCI